MQPEYVAPVTLPFLALPKQFTSIQMNRESMYDNIYMNVSITTPYLDGAPCSMYSGPCRVQFKASYPDDRAEVEQEITTESSLYCDDINKMPVIFSDVSNCSDQPYDQSQVWKDPSVSPHVYNHYDRPVQQTYSVVDNSGHITVQQHNTYTILAQNVYNYDRPQTDPEQVGYKRMRETPKRPLSPEIFYDDEESESEMLLSQLSKKKKKNKGDNVARAQGDNDALKQLMATTTKSKQRKTILFQGENSERGQTIQTILITDPNVKCSPVTPTYEESSASNPNKKKYQCAKCKTIFDKISQFRQHLVGNDTKYQLVEKSSQYICSECGRKFSNQFKYQTHCMGHGDPDLECPKCHKVYASKNNLKIHLRIHNRKYRCMYCTRSYDNVDVYKSHMKTHSKFVCQYKDCLYTANSKSKRDDHYDEHIKEYHINNDPSNDDYGFEEIDTDSADNNHQSNDHIDPYSSDQNNRASSGFDEPLNHVYNDDIEEQFGIAKTSSNTDIGDSFLADFGEDFEDDLIITECELSSETSDLILASEITISYDITTEDSSSGSNEIIVDEIEPEKDYNNKAGRYKNEGEDNANKNKYKEPDMNENATLEDIDKEERVKTAESVIKAMSDKLFLLNNRKKNKYVRGNKHCR